MTRSRARADASSASAHRAPRMRAVIALVAVAAALCVTFAPSASSDPISDKKAEAERIAARIEQLNGAVEQYAEQANGAQIELDQINAQVADTTAKVAA